jgi:hypothetical protein
MIFPIRLLLFSAIVFAGPEALASKPMLPPDLFTFDKLSEDVRGVVGLKIRDMTRSFTMREVAPGKIVFSGSDGIPKSTITYVHSKTALPDGNFEIQATVTILRHDNRVLLEEKIISRGKAPIENSPRDRLFFDGDISYALAAGEDFKQVDITSDGNDLFRFVSFRRGTPLTGTVVVNEMHIGKGKVLEIEDAVSSDGTFRGVNYFVWSEYFVVSAFGETLYSGNWNRMKLKVLAARPAGYVIENHRYHLDGMEVFGLAEFLKEFNHRVYKRFILDGANKVVKHLVEEKFPKTPKHTDFAIRERFLDDLQTVLNLVEQAKGNPAILPRVSTLVQSFIGAMRQGTLKVIDLREDGKP